MHPCKFAGCSIKYPLIINGHYNIKLIFNPGHIIFIAMARGGMHQPGPIFPRNIISQHYCPLR